MAFNDGTAEARVAARYANITAEDIHRVQVAHNAALAARDSAPRNTQHQAASAHHPARVTHIRRASDKAINFLVALSNERSTVAEDVAREWAERVDAREVSAKIDWLKTQPKIVNSGVGTRQYDVPAGRYAVTGNDGQTVFVKVSRPTDGPFAGKVFVNVQAGDELIRVSPAVRDALLAKIEQQGPAEASKRYGREIGSCGVCGRTLTDEESRAAGIGPVCAAKTGW